MIVDDFNMLGSRSCPDEAHAPLVFDADAVPAAAIAFQRLETVRGRRGQVGNTNRRVQHLQLARGDPLDIGEPPDAIATEQCPRFRATERADHD